MEEKNQLPIRKQSLRFAPIFAMLSFIVVGTMKNYNKLFIFQDLTIYPRNL